MFHSILAHAFGNISNVVERRPNQIGPGRKSNLRYVKPSRYMPHQGEQEKARRRARLTPTVGSVTNATWRKIHEAALVKSEMAEEPVHTDSNGQPWNPDLHAATRSLNKDGTWRKKGGRR